MISVSSLKKHVEEVFWCRPQFVTCPLEFLRQNVVSPKEITSFTKLHSNSPNFECRQRGENTNENVVCAKDVKEGHAMKVNFLARRSWGCEVPIGMS